MSNKALKNPPPWNAFSLKILLHIGSFAGTKWRYLDTLSPLENPKSQRSRVAGYNTVVKQLVRDGLVEVSVRGDRLPTLTAKGKVFIDAMLNLPLPVQTAPEWVVPK